ncbi:cadherin repeat domain-containing protein [Aliamphritea spongicola]|nr:cadherin repeat domain-containing protein [Aliamphritea spongicola]
MANKDINNAQGIFAPASSSINGQQSAVTSPAPTFTVAENLSGATIGTFRANDQDNGQTHTFSVDDARFEFVGAELKLKDEFSLDYEEAALVPLVVTVTDSGGLSNQMNITVGVLNAGSQLIRN